MVEVVVVAVVVTYIHMCHLILYNGSSILYK